MCLDSTGRGGRTGIEEADLTSCSRAVPDVDLKIALFHHRFTQFERTDASRVRNFLQGPDGAQLLMHGFQHSDQWARWGPDRRALELCSGPCFLNRVGTPSVYVGQLFFDRGFGRHTTFAYDRESGTWHLNPTDSSDALEGSWEFEIPSRWYRSNETPRLRKVPEPEPSAVKKRLPIGSSDFEHIIEEGFYFVDKSHLIREVWDADTVALLPRPRGFGKTLNMEMLRTFFEISERSKLHLFDDLRIQYDLEMMGHAGQYPVISISFKDVKADNWTLCLEKFKRSIGAEFERHNVVEPDLNGRDQKLFDRIAGFEAEQADVEISLEFLSRILHQRHLQKALILIDEYDTPLLTAHHHGYLDQCLSFLRNFFSAAFKSNRALLKGVLTGIMRVARESVFSGLNNVTVYGLFAEPFADCFGFTDDEVLEALIVYELDPLADEVRAWYNGYTLGNRRLYNPWSVSGYLKNREIRPYWINTSDNALIRDLITRGPTAIEEDIARLLHDEGIDCYLREDIAFRDVQGDRDELWSFLVFTGYLTVEDGTVSKSDQRVRLRIPNREVRVFFEQTLARWLTAPMGDAILTRMSRALLGGDLETFAGDLKTLVLEVMSYHDPAGREAERVYHAFVLGLLVHLRRDYHVRSNRESGHGRYDIMLIPRRSGEYGIILEFKLAGTLGFEKATQIALEQIKAHGYAQELISRGFDRARAIAFAFEGKHHHVNGETLDLIREPLAEG